MTQPVDSLNQPKLAQKTFDSDRDWLDSDLSRLEEYEPYDWGDTDPLTLGKPVQYTPGIELVIKSIHDIINQ